MKAKRRISQQNIPASRKAPRQPRRPASLPHEAASSAQLLLEGLKVAPQSSKDLKRIKKYFDVCIKELEKKNKRIEASLLSNAKMSALGEMAASIAHEINNPLAIIYANACRISRDIENGNFKPELIQKRVRTIEQTSLRIEKIIEGLRVVSRETRHDQLQTENLNEIIHLTLNLCEAKIKANRVDLRLEMARENLEIECRPVQISQILLNLLNNAFDAVTNLKERWIKLAVLEHKRTVEVVISNSGPAIPSPLSKKIFQPFVTTKPVGQGTGLGLSISKSLAESNGGSLTLTTAKHPTFRLRLPIASRKEMK